ncbi:hypothetical protein B0J13DRAFT_282093 [Dactylonectria estremocensis]|uniref:Uncharacterized protein n=1 Tax=Dactylonectria estremocensis TaxID=1079267 RepID=A0A9P9J965_9HYPO|nr:hypothetical protein B0J13DRAFT_282093 [Dactylonectria estremocensis]
MVGTWAIFGGLMSEGRLLGDWVAGKRALRYAVRTNVTAAPVNYEQCAPSNVTGNGTRPLHWELQVTNRPAHEWMSGAVSSMIHSALVASALWPAARARFPRGTRPEAAPEATPEAAPERRLRRRGSTCRSGRVSGTATKGCFGEFGGLGLESSESKAAPSGGLNVGIPSWLVGGQGRFEARHSKPHPATPHAKVTGEHEAPTEQDPTEKQKLGRGKDATSR